MLRGGVIMDVVNAEQAKIAEDAGAVSVMALERVPADIRRDGGVARMSDPVLIEGIIDAVTIPVMAKARIGHFAEAQVLQCLGVDFIDESEVLTPADEAHHIDKWPLHGPLRVRGDEPGRGAAADLGGCGHDPLQGRGRDREHRRGGAAPALHPRRPPCDRAGRPGRALRLGQGAGRAGRPRAGDRTTTGRLPVPLFCAGGIATPADAALVMQLGAEAVFVGSGIFKSSDPARMASAIVEATAHYTDADHVAKVSRGLGEAMRGSGGVGSTASISPTGGGSGASASASTAPLIGVLDLQGDVREHVAALGDVGVRGRLVKRPADLDGLAGLDPAGRRVDDAVHAAWSRPGCSTPIAERLSGDPAPMPVLGTCAGLVLLAREVLDGRPDQRTLRRARRGGPAQRLRAPGRVVRGRARVGSGEGPPLPAVFIRAPLVVSRRGRRRGAGRVRRGAGAGAAGTGAGVVFHPELTPDRRVHHLFARLCDDS